MVHKLLIEAVSVGIILLFISILVMGCFETIYPGKKSQRVYYVLTLLIGILTHLTCEFSGLNRWYCRNGNACASHPASW
jgi:hypothetical protein